MNPLLGARVRLRAAMLLGGGIACLIAAAPATAGAKETGHGAGEFATVSYPVTFTVTDTDTTSLVKTNPGDGKTYEVHGHITAPVGALDASAPAATVYMAGLGYGEWLWRFTSVPGYNYAANAAAQGLTSVTVDKLGYGDSGIPDGDDVGYGTEATVDHEIIQDLRDGQYTLDGHAPVAFSKVALGAQAQSVFSAELEAYTYKDVNALVLTNFADEGFSPSLLANYSINVANCVADPLTEGGPGTPSGYQYRERSSAAFIADDLQNTSPAVQQAAAALHSKDPCGYPTFSVEPTLFENNLFGLSLRVPLISVIGSDDPDFFPDSLAVAYQRLEFSLDPDATVEELNGGAQAITLGLTAPAYLADNVGFLCKQGFGYDDCVAP